MIFTKKDKILIFDFFKFKIGVGIVYLRVKLDYLKIDQRKISFITVI